MRSRPCRRPRLMRQLGSCAAQHGSGPCFGRMDSRGRTWRPVGIRPSRPGHRFCTSQGGVRDGGRQSANGLLHYLCTVLPADENSAFDYPRADDLNRAISLIAAGKAVDEFHAEIFADLAVCRITLERLLQNLRGPVRFDLSEELRFALQYYKYDPKDQIDREVKIVNRPLLEFSVRSATRLMTTCLELITAANQYRATVELSRKKQQLSAVTPVEANLGEIKHATPPKKANAARARRLNGSTVPKLPRKTDLTMGRNGNSHTRRSCRKAGNT